jgi:hypothetical protein
MAYYFKNLWLLLEYLGFHPRISLDRGEEWMEMLNKAGWRPFRIEHYR